MDRELRSALLSKEQAELFLSNLEKLFTDEVVNETSYNTLKSEYSTNLEHAQIKVEQIKQALDKKIAIKARELNIYKQELANLDARFKVGQLSANEFIKLSRIPDKKISSLEETVAQLTSLFNSKRSADIDVQEASAIGVLFPSKSKKVNKPLIIAQPEPQALYPQPDIAPEVAEPQPIISDPTYISDLLILPDRVMQGSTVGVIATITNQGNETVQHRTEFKINDHLESVNELLLNPGQSEELTFMTVAGTPGDYYISVDKATGILKVLPAR